MTLATAVVWFIVSGAPLNNRYYVLGTLGPFTTQERCEVNRKNLSAYMDKGFIGYPFLERTKCLPMEIVIGTNP